MPRKTRFTSTAGVLVLLLAAGCGMEPVDNRMQTRGQLGNDQFAIEVVEGEFVCPHVVSINNQSFDVKAVIGGEVQDHFGPFVPCLTTVQPGQGTCTNCKNPYRTSGELAEGEEGPTLALPKIRCPHQDNHSAEQLVDPTAVLVKGSKDSVLGYSNCPTCKRYYTVKETDLVMTIDVPEETLCPNCTKPVNPMMNECRNAKCKDALGGVVRNIKSFDGPCWRCGGVGHCTNCRGSGQGNLGMYGSTPAECWICANDGDCPECDGTGFSKYEGVLPKSYTAWGREAAVPSPRRKWEHKRESGGGGDMAVEDDG
jgi:hypothetical protein